MKNYKEYIIGLLLLWVLSNDIMAQSLDNLKDKDPVKVSGGIGFNSIGYQADGIESRRDPFSWYLSGNLNIALYGWNVPLTFSYTNRQTNFTQPFNQVGFTPQYKWVKVHAGYSSLQFSSYSLSGHTFLGGGVELTPGKWQVSAMYGRLNKATEAQAIDSLNFTDPVFQRMGLGTKVGYKGEGYHVEASIFAAEDDFESLSFIPEGSEITPEENLVWTLAGSKTLFKKLALSGEFARSYYTRDTRDVSLTPISSPANTTEANKSAFSAYNFGLGYNGQNYTLGFKYERIDPEYTTLGAYYNQNDMENMTLDGNFTLLKGKMNLATSGGIQHNNLDDTEASATRRLIGSINLNYVASQAWNYTVSYSNFNTFTNVRPQVDPTLRDELDTLNFFQVSQTASGNIIHSFGNDQVKKSFSLNTSYQVTSEDSPGDDQDTQSDFYSGNISYRTSYKKGTSLSVSLNGTQSVFGEQKTTSYGPNMTLTRPLLEKRIRASFSAGYLSQTSQENTKNGVLTIRTGFSLVPKKKKQDTRGKARIPESEIPESQEKASKQKGKQKTDDTYSKVTQLEMPASLRAAAQTKKSKKGAKKFKFPGSQQVSLNIGYVQRTSSLETRPSFSELTITLNYSYKF